jgi:polysaccharide export outer membrane protein
MGVRMKSKVWMLVVLLTVGVAAVSGASEPANTDYVIGPGDVLDISTWKDESLTKSVVVLPDGKISFPLIGVFRAGGRTVPELRQEILDAIVKYVPDPVLTVEVKQVNSLLIYVIGRVNAPGKFLLNSNVTVLQALAMAGGLNPFAKKDKIRIIRQDGNRHTVIPFQYDDVVEDAKLEQNIRLQRGDVVVVP